MRGAILFLSVATLAPSTDAAPEFRGYVETPAHSWFLLIDRERGTKRWVKTGEKFGDLFVIAFDEKMSRLVVAKGEQLLTLPLKGRADAGAAPELLPGGFARWRERAIALAHEGDSLATKLLAEIRAAEASARQGDAGAAARIATLYDRLQPLVAERDALARRRR